MTELCKRLLTATTTLYNSLDHLPCTLIYVNILFRVLRHSGRVCFVKSGLLFKSGGCGTAFSKKLEQRQLPLSSEIAKSSVLISLCGYRHLHWCSPIDSHGTVVVQVSVDRPLFFACLAGHRSLCQLQWVRFYLLESLGTILSFSNDLLPASLTYQAF